MNRIRRHSLVFFNVALLLSLAFAETVVKDNSNPPTMDRGRVITWSTNDESHVKVFEIWRSSIIDSSSNFVRIAQVPPCGNHSDYLYRDTSLPTMTEDVCTYKIVAHGYSSDLVERTIRANKFGAAVQQTWACIETVFQ
jgi:hypothetical protein